MSNTLTLMLASSDQSFRDMLHDNILNIPDIKVVATVFTGWALNKAAQQIKDLLASGKQIDGVWTSGIDVVVPEAYKTANAKFVPVVGADNNGFVGQLINWRGDGLSGAAVTNPPSVGGAGLVLIDTAPHSESASLAAARAADLVLIPCRPGIIDLRAIGMSAELARLAGKRAYVVLNAMPPRATHLAADARAAVATHGLAVAPIMIQQRAAYGHALIAGQTAQEFEPHGKAAEELGKLYEWLGTCLNS